MLELTGGDPRMTNDMPAGNAKVISDRPILRAAIAKSIRDL
jgi:hypothetical protein